MATGNIHLFAGITVGSEQINLPYRPWNGSGEIHEYDGSSAINFTVVPPVMPSDKTPSKLFALTLRSSFSIHIDDLYSFAFCIKKVAGRA